MLIRTIVSIMIVFGTIVAGGYWWIAGLLYVLMLMDTNRRQKQANDPELDAYIHNNNSWAEAFGLVAIIVVCIIALLSV